MCHVHNFPFKQFISGLLMCSDTFSFRTSQDQFVAYVKCQFRLHWVLAVRLGFVRRDGIFSLLHPVPFRRLNIKRWIYRISYSIRLLPSRFYKITRDPADVHSYNPIPSLDWGSSIPFSNDFILAYQGPCMNSCVFK